MMHAVTALLLMLIKPRVPLLDPLLDVLSVCATAALMKPMGRLPARARDVGWKLYLGLSIVLTLGQIAEAANPLWLLALGYQAAWLLVFLYLFACVPFDLAWSWVVWLGNRFEELLLRTLDRFLPGRGR